MHFVSLPGTDRAAHSFPHALWAHGLAWWRTQNQRVAREGFPEGIPWHGAPFFEAAAGLGRDPGLSLCTPTGIPSEFATRTVPGLLALLRAGDSLRAYGACLHVSMGLFSDTKSD